MPDTGECLLIVAVTQLTRIQGKTRYYDFKVSRTTMSPDGTPMSLLVVNGQFPGPTLEANWGDWIEVTVKNEIAGPEENTIIHWHGLNQPGTPWYDGVPSVSHCPIVPGTSLKYRFRADEYGTSWWHSHLSAQYTQGLFGPIVVHGPSDYVDYDEDLGPVMINDWYHAYYSDIVNQVNTPPPPGAPPPIPSSQSNLVNGAGRFSPGTVNTTTGQPLPNATASSPSSSDVPYTSWKVEAGKTYRMRLVNAGSVGFERVSIDGHQIKIIANDFVPVQPYEVDFVTLAVGQRSDIVFTASGEPGQTYWFRATNDVLCGQTAGPDGRGIIAYGDADPSVEPTSTTTALPPNTSCANDALSLTVPVYADPVQDPDVTITITVGPQPDANGVFRWVMNGVAFKGDPSAPMLLSTITEDSTTYPPERNVYDLGSNNTVRIIVNNIFRAPHPNASSRTRLPGAILRGGQLGWHHSESFEPTET